ncbi:helix-turn-helix domain-containing protein [Aquipuribacter nitratireducens]|uniref:Helix-turn-helix domain-containing protein n=1 Tax=Aquipuribacter nitratireducens TaxID=650104 RepID=A0ABW0GIT7_9MICO
MADGTLPRRTAIHAEVSHDDAPSPVSGRLLASWQRSEDYGVSLDSVDPVFSGTYDTESLFFRCGAQVLADLHATLVGEPVSLMLTDPDGLVLNRLSGDTSLLRSLDAVHLAPGFSYAEREAGTNGLGLALADRVPTLVRASEHYAVSLCTYTCAAAPVLDPRTGRVEGAVNLTTWSDTRSDLLLALAQSAAGNTAALMLARAGGRTPRPAPPGRVFRVEPGRLEPGSGSLDELSTAWTDAVAGAAAALGHDRVVVAVGEPGNGRATLLAQAERRLRRHDRILSAAPPAPKDVETWLDLWAPELRHDHTAVVVRDVDTLPLWAAERLRDLVVRARSERGGATGDVLPFAMTATRYDDVPEPLAALVDTVVPLAPLRERPDDVLPLAHHAARAARGRDVTITAAAATGLRGYAWPGGVAELVRVVRDAAVRADIVDVAHLPADLFSGSAHRLSRIERFERDEIVRVLSRSELTMREAAEELGMSRATLYRKVGQYGIRVPGR